MNILIIEDEILAYQKLLKLIQSEFPEAKIVGWARSLVETKLLIEQHDKIDLIFSDIELLDGISFDVLNVENTNAPIIFCTAYDRYILDAFQSNGIAFLLKPYDENDFKNAIVKYSKLFGEQKGNNIDHALIKNLKEILNADKKSYQQRFSIKKKEGIKILKTDDIVLLNANGDFLLAHDSAKERHVINYNLSEIELKLNPKNFFKINRSQIINIKFIKSIESYSKNKLCIKLQFISDPVFTSNTKTPAFRKWLDS